MVVQDGNDPNSDGSMMDYLRSLLPDGFENFAEGVEGVGQGLGLLVGAVQLNSMRAGALTKSMGFLKDSYDKFSNTFQQEIVKSNDSLVAVNSSLARITEEYAVTIAQTALPLKTALDALVNFEMAGLQDVPPAVLQLAGIMDLTNQKQENFIRLVSDMMVFGGVDTDGTSQIAQNMMRVSDEFSVSFDKLVQALEPVATNSAKLALVSETAALSNAQLVTELAGAVGQDATGLLRNVIERLSSLTQISPNEDALEFFAELRDAMQEGSLSAEEFKELLPKAFADVEALIGPVLEAREGIQTVERREAAKLFDLETASMMKALVRQLEIGNERELDPNVAGFRTLSEFQARMFDAFYQSIAEMDPQKLFLLAENLGKLGAVILEFGAAVAPVVAALLEGLRSELNKTTAGGAGNFLAGIIDHSFVRGVIGSLDIVADVIPAIGNIRDSFVTEAGLDPTSDTSSFPDAIQAILRSTGMDNFASQFADLQTDIGRGNMQQVEQSAERLFAVLTGIEASAAGAVAANIADDRARAIELLERSIMAPNITDALIEKLEIAIDALNNTTADGFGGLIEINSGGFAETGQAARARIEQADARAAAGN